MMIRVMGDTGSDTKSPLLDSCSGYQLVFNCITKMIMNNGLFLTISIASHSNKVF